MATVIASDQITKYLIETHMHLWQSVVVIKNVLNLTYAKNKGMGFSVFQSNPKLVEYLVIPTIIVLVAFSILWKDKKDWFFELSMGLIIGGAFSNALNRLISGTVTDFIQLPYWPIFNVADSCVVAGAIGIGIYFLKREKKVGKD
ncbi:signal peptidase II [Mesoaciditoga lauensis]|uniref:signal peptidase II n=1 Tax=Mesoaciditoga lauensis TaxID=1495039 RepID=UPI00068D11E6|nr:signal peptidase II [Mesoaciditoga lauensis]